MIKSMAGSRVAACATDSVRKLRVFISGLLLSFIALCLFVAQAHADEVQVSYKRGYVDGRFGQIHYHIAQPASGKTKLTPIVFLHQNPKSAYEYEFLTREMGKDRVAIAIDTPGYGESDRPPAPPTMEDLAGAMADALDALGYGKGRKKKGQVDVFGFHTGVFMSAELAVQRPDLVRRVVLSGIPYRPQDVRKARLAVLPQEFGLPEDGSRTMQRWQSIVQARQDGVSLERATKDFIEDLHSTGYWWYAYNAVWRYPVEERFAAITQPVFILEPHEMDLEETRKAHRELLPHADYVEIPEITERSRVFDLGWPLYAKELRAWLDQPVQQSPKK
jgi:pimeloyl-ACP methyl ester carboxylesterase